MSRYQPQTDALKRGLHEMVKDWESGTFGALGSADLAEIATTEVVPHMVAAYKEGRMKATASIGRRLVQKNLELSRKLRQVREAVMNQSHLHSLQNVLTDVLGEDEGPTTAEQEIRAKALEEVAEWLENGYDRTPATIARELRAMARPAVREDGKYGRPDCPAGGHAFPEIVCDDRCTETAKNLDRLKAALAKGGA